VNDYVTDKKHLTSVLPSKTLQLSLVKNVSGQVWTAIQTPIRVCRGSHRGFAPLEIGAKKQTFLKTWNQQFKFVCRYDTHTAQGL